MKNCMFILFFVSAHILSMDSKKVKITNKTYSTLTMFGDNFKKYHFVRTVDEKKHILISSGVEKQKYIVKFYCCPDHSYVEHEFYLKPDSEVAIAHYFIERDNEGHIIFKIQ